MQELKLGDSQVTPSKYSSRLKRLSLGVPRKASHLSSTSIGMFQIRFIHVICANLEASFAFSFHFYLMHHAVMRQSMVDLQNALCTSLISFECGFIECFMCFTYHLKFGLPVSLHIENRHLQNALLLHLYLLERGHIFCRKN